MADRGWWKRGSAAQGRRGQRTPQGFLQGSLEEIVGGQAQPVVLWKPRCVFLNLPPSR